MTTLQLWLPTQVFLFAFAVVLVPIYLSQLVVADAVAAVVAVDARDWSV